MEVALVLLPPLVHAYARGSGFAQLGLIVVVFVAALVVGVALPGQAANVICYKTTSMMWDATQSWAIPVSPEILERRARQDVEKTAALTGGPHPVTQRLMQRR